MRWASAHGDKRAVGDGSRPALTHGHHAPGLDRLAGMGGDEQQGSSEEQQASLNQGKCKVLHLGRDSPRHQDVLGGAHSWKAALQKRSWWTPN